jgi:hypothetical protein
MCFGCQLNPKNLITNAKMSCPPFEIHKSKLAIVKWHYIKVTITYNCLAFPLNQAKIHEKIVFQEGKISLGHKCILNHFN